MSQETITACSSHWATQDKDGLITALEKELRKVRAENEQLRKKLQEVHTHIESV